MKYLGHSIRRGDRKHLRFWSVSRILIALAICAVPFVAKWPECVQVGEEL